MRTQTTGLSAVSDAIATATSDSAIATAVDRRRNFAVISHPALVLHPIALYPKDNWLEFMLSHLHRPI